MLINTIVSIIIISAVGTLAHFLYDLTRHNQIIGLFAAVNESTWEHIKIALTPTLLWSLVDGIFYGQNPNYFLAKLVSLIVPVIVIPVIFYGYRSFSKKSVLAVDILMFYVAICLSQFAMMGILELPEMPFVVRYLACLGTFVFFGAYLLLTLLPLRMFMFLDPITNRYGFKAHSDKFNPFKKRKK